MGNTTSSMLSGQTTPDVDRVSVEKRIFSNLPVPLNGVGIIIQANEPQHKIAGMTEGQFAFAVLGAVIGLATIAVTVWIFCHKRRAKKRALVDVEMVQISNAPGIGLVTGGQQFDAAQQTSGSTVAVGGVDNDAVAAGGANHNAVPVAGIDDHASTSLGHEWAVVRGGLGMPIEVGLDEGDVGDDE